jgi:hypothetical protein
VTPQVNMFDHLVENMGQRLAIIFVAGVEE